MWGGQRLGQESLGRREECGAWWQVGLGGQGWRLRDQLAWGLHIWGRPSEAGMAWEPLAAPNKHLSFSVLSPVWVSSYRPL